jgi:hypothetical protein
MPDTINIPTDGFVLNPAIRLWPYNYTAGALSQMDTLRRAATYRPRIYSVPDDYNQPLAAYETLEYQIKVAEGSYIWGLLFRQFNTLSQQVSPTGIVIQLSDACTGIPFYSEFSQAQGLAFYNASPLASGISMPHILTQPRLLLAPGDVNVELCNINSDPVYCQLLIFTAEPCEMIQE